LTVGSPAALITATVEAAGGGPVVDGTTVAFTTTLGVVTRTAPTTGGVATATLLPGTTAGQARLTAAAGSAGDAVEVTLSPGPAAAVAIVPAGAQAEVGTVVPLALTVADLYGNGVDRQPILLRADNGAVTPTLVVARGGSAAAAVSTTAAAKVVITATAATASGSTAVEFVPGPPAQLSVSVEALQIPVDDGATAIGLRVRDRFGNRVANPVTVDLAANGGTVQPRQVVALNGVAAAEYRARSEAGVFQVSASAPGGLTAAGDVELRPADLSVATEIIGPRGMVPPEQIRPGDEVTYRLTVANGTWTAATPLPSTSRAASTAPVPGPATTRCCCAPPSATTRPRLRRRTCAAAT
jgi:hypothetical protein